MRLPAPLRRALERSRRNTTPAGRVVLALIALSGAASLISPYVPIHHPASALFMVYLVGAVAVRLVRSRLRVALELPEACRAGEPFAARLAVENAAEAPVHDLSLELFDLPDALEPSGPPPFVATLPGRGRAAGEVTLLPLRRGIHRIGGACATTSFPFGLARRVLARAAPATVKADPAFTPLVSLDLPLGRLHQPGGIALTSHTGESPEYIGSREYRPGDPVRRLDHRSFARTGKPAVREYQEEYYARVALVLDTYVPPGKRRPRAGYPHLEAAVSLAAAVADRLARDEYVIDLFAAGPELYVFRAGRNLAHLRQVLDVLACVDACCENPFETIGPALADELPRLSCLVCVFLGWDEARDRFVREAAWAGAAPRVLLVGDGSFPDGAGEVDGASVTPLSADAILAGRVDRL